jgi:hypothetical protein
MCSYLTTQIFFFEGKLYGHNQFTAAKKEISENPKAVRRIRSLVVFH